LAYWFECFITALYNRNLYKNQIICLDLAAELRPSPVFGHHESEWKVEGHLNSSVNDRNRGLVLWQANKTQLIVWISEWWCQLSFYQPPVAWQSEMSFRRTTPLQGRICIGHHG